MSKSLKKLIDINRLREFKNKLVGVGSAYVQTSAVDQTIAGTKTFSKPIVGSVTGSSGSCTGNAATATIATTAKACTGNAATATKATQDSVGQQIDTTYIKGLAVSGRTITYTKGDGSTGTITTQDTNTWTAFKGATSSANGTAGYVPAPTKGNQDKFFKADGTWATPPNTTYASMSASEATTGTATAARTISAKVLHDKINSNLSAYSKNGHTHDDRYYTETEVNNLLNGKANSSHTHPYIPTSASCNKNWHWSGRAGQPTWLWGGEDGTNMYIYNPSDFRVNYANSANSAVTAAYATSVRTPDNNHTIKFDWSSQVSGCVGLTVDSTKMGGILTTENTARSLARVGTYDIGSTIHARTDTQAEYGATVAGSQLKYAAMDSGDGIYDPNRQLTTVGTWLKVSGNSGNTDGSGLYRRIA